MQDNTEQWLVFTRYDEFRQCHKVLNRRLSPCIAGHLAIPRFPRRIMPGDKPTRLEARLRGLQMYLTELLRLL